MSRLDPSCPEPRVKIIFYYSNGEIYFNQLKIQNKLNFYIIINISSKQNAFPQTFPRTIVCFINPKNTIYTILLPPMYSVTFLTIKFNSMKKILQKLISFY